jgi:hypothetical protein
VSRRRFLWQVVRDNEDPQEPRDLLLTLPAPALAKRQMTMGRTSRDRYLHVMATEVRPSQQTKNNTLACYHRSCLAYYRNRAILLKRRISPPLHRSSEETFGNKKLAYEHGFACLKTWR